MDTYRAWEVWCHSNIPVVMLIIISGTGGFAWMFNRLLNQHKDFCAMKENFHKELEIKQNMVEKSQITRLVDKIEVLVEQNRQLFQKHDNHNERLNEFGHRINKVEKRVGENTMRCDEREKVLISLKAQQESHNKAFLCRTTNIFPNSSADG